MCWEEGKPKNGVFSSTFSLFRSCCRPKNKALRQHHSTTLPLISHPVSTPPPPTDSFLKFLESSAVPVPGNVRNVKTLPAPESCGRAQMTPCSFSLSTCSSHVRLFLSAPSVRLSDWLAARLFQPADWLISTYF